MSDRRRLGSMVPAEQDDSGAHAHPPKRFGGPGKVVAAVVPFVQLARLGLPALLAASGVAVLVLVAACWVLDDDGRAERLALIVAALNGMAECFLPRPRRPRHARPTRLTVIRSAEEVPVADHRPGADETAYAISAGRKVARGGAIDATLAPSTDVMACHHLC